MEGLVHYSGSSDDGSDGEQEGSREQLAPPHGSSALQNEAPHAQQATVNSSPETSEEDGASSSGSSSSDDEAEGCSSSPKHKRPRHGESSGASDSKNMGAADWEPPSLQATGTGPARAAAPGHASRAAHQGRVRTFPHVEGLYPTTVMIPVELSSQQCAALGQLLASLQQLVPGLKPMVTLPASAEVPAAAAAAAAPAAAASSCTPGQLQVSTGGGAPDTAAVRNGATGTTATAAGGARAGGKITTHTGKKWPKWPPELLHISLSRTVPVRFALLEELTGALKDSLRDAVPAARPFSLFMAGLKVFVNDEKTRTFVSVPVVQGRQQVCTMIKAVDRVFKLHGLQLFHEDPKPHLSVGWVLGDQQSELEQAVQAWEASHASTHTEDGSKEQAEEHQQASEGGNAGFAVEMAVQVVVCRAGQRDYVVWHTQK